MTQQKPQRSLRLNNYTSQDLSRLSGREGELFYDRDLNTLKVYNGGGAADQSVMATRAWVSGNYASTASLTTTLAAYATTTAVTATLTNYVTGSSLGSTLNSYLLKNLRVVTGGVAPQGFSPVYYNPSTQEFIVVTA